MFVNQFEADSYDEEAQVKYVVSLTIEDLTKSLNNGETLVTEWFKLHGYNAEYRIIVEGRKTGIGRKSGLIDPRDGSNLIISG